VSALATFTGWLRAHASPRRLGRRGWAAVAVLLVLVGVLAVDATWRTIDVRRELSAAAADIGSTRATLGPLLQMDTSKWPNRARYDQLVRDLDSASAHLDRASRRLGYLRGVASVCGWVPVLGPQLAAGPRGLDLGQDVVTQAGMLLRDGEPLFAGQGNAAERAREVLVLRHDRIDAELAALEAAGAEADRLRAIRWTWPLGRVASLLDQVSGDLARVSGARALAASAATGLDPLLGFDGPRTYVVLGQNEQEIRPTGGFAGTMGVIVIERGRLVSSDYRSSYDFDPAVQPSRLPPASLADTMGATRWYVRDANWDADFRVSAQRVLDFLQQDQGIRADGVIAVDTPMIQLLLQATGPLVVDGIPEPLTSANFLAQLESELFEPGVDSQLRKRQLLQPVLRQLIGRVQDANAESVPPLLAALRRGTQGRDLQVYARDERVNALIDQIGASGRLEARAGRDFVAVVDSNISYDKIQVAIRREITYLARSDGRVDLLVRWTNERSTFAGPRYPRLGEGGALWDPGRAHLDAAPGVFGNYARVFLPAGTTLDFISGFTRRPALEQAGGLTVLSGLVVVEDGQTVSLRITYRPGGANTATGVDFWKQGGQTRDTLRVFLADGVTQAVPFDGPFTHDLAFDYPPAGRPR